MVRFDKSRKKGAAVLVELLRDIHNGRAATLILKSIRFGWYQSQFDAFIAYRQRT